ncbi:MAG: hypothetical protein ACP5JG_01790 [Anaerolineae bacterium]
MSDDAWGLELTPVICNTCDWRYLAPEEHVPARCPHCAAATLEALPAENAFLPYARPPELVVPFSASQGVIAEGIQRFAGGIPLPPKDLSVYSLQERAQQLYLPMWLVDVDVEAQWQAEMGFDYEVVSHQERYSDGGGWDTQRVREERVRWEPRVGRLSRRYENVASPALERHVELRRALGDVDAHDAVLYQPGLLDAAVVRMPDLDPKAAWPAAVPSLHRAAADECRRAARADHVRSFQWRPSYAGRNWTLLLLPFYATYYMDDAGDPQRVLLNGQTGQVYGRRRGSTTRAQQIALIAGLIALVLFLVSLGLGLASFLLPPLLAVGIIGIIVSLLVAVGAFVPMVQVWAFNRREARAEGQA